MSYDFSLGVQTGITDPNGISATYQYDVFGRKTRENRIDGTYSVWAYYLCTDSASYCYWGDSATFYLINRYDYSTDGSTMKWVVT